MFDYTRWTQVQLQPSETSYFSTPTDHLDPYLFDGMHFSPTLRQEIVSFVLAVLGKHFSGAQEWVKVWACGSGVSYQWSAAREPGDLDVLIGVEWLQFRRSNRDFAGLSDEEISAFINARFRDALAQFDHHWHGRYDLTVYLNPATGNDIRSLHPYAAYDLTDDSWSVMPDPSPQHPDLDFSEDTRRAQEIAQAYDQALEDVKGTVNPAYRTNAAARLRIATQHALDLFEDIHGGRREAFGATGLGYSDPANARWMTAKASGVYQALLRIKSDIEEATATNQRSLYGEELLSARDVLVAAALSRRFKP